MENIVVKEIAIDEQIKKLRKAIDHERKLYFKHLSVVAVLKKELSSLLKQREILYPEQYTKYGNVRKRYKGTF